MGPGLARNRKLFIAISLTVLIPNEVRALHGESSTGRASYVDLICFIRLFGSRRFFEWAERKSERSLFTDTDPDCKPGCFFAADAGRFEAVAASGAEQ